MRRLVAGLFVGSLVLLAGCPQVELVEARVHSPEDCVLVVHSKVQDLSHVDQQCRVVAEFGDWRGVGRTPMVRAIPEPQDVYSEIKRWERAYSGVAAGQMRIRFFYRNELLAQRFFPSPDFTEESLERQQYWEDRDTPEWPPAENTNPQGQQKRNSRAAR